MIRPLDLLPTMSIMLGALPKPSVHPPTRRMVKQGLFHLLILVLTSVAAEAMCTPLTPRKMEDSA
ncbi:hypothetical protein, partial [Cupriavidus metallidurans]|uniref:hypothetical protein n=1 Tax=Cupriavidus metallidurans TaxID=119219 RepID=UPI001D131710